jgi:hypothetical protein
MSLDMVLYAAARGVVISMACDAVGLPWWSGIVVVMVLLLDDLLLARLTRDK